jgi:branched-chain amino acid transport system substrate-binding protein
MRIGKTTLRLAAVGTALALVLVACGGRDDNASTGGGGTATTAGTGGGEEAALSIDTADCESYDGTQGVTDTSIKIGTSLPLSGPYATAFAAINKGYKAYFDYVNNEKGGVQGRKIELVSLDDEYNAGNTKANVDKLVADEKVFALFNIVGTANNLAFRDDYNAVESLCVPNLFVATGSEQWGETEEYPWLIGSIPSYATEAAVFVDYLEATNPQAKVALLYQNDDFGEGYRKALQKAVEGTGITIVDEESFNSSDQDPTPQITALSSSGADTAFIGITGLPCATAMKAVAGIGNWKPLTYISQTCTSQIILNVATDSGANPGVVDGVLSTGYVMDPADPEFDDDPGMVEYKRIARAQGLSDAEINNGYTAYGWTMGQLLEATLNQAPSLDRKTVMETAYSLQDLDLPLLRTPIVVNTAGAADPFPIESLYVIKYDSATGRWVEQGEVIDLEGRTSEFIPEG